MARRPYITGQ
ncbi:uncharacterized protein FTOL_07851 [Fusarium torulosum]|uniref:Uncharacterized protein n=1 Tax=Fusarium torulosum TaxID=33205 RepID=A0AAE8MCP7_9HYPO|nr:uncharacterized protein FTOL_07851 [Fusarium torulosum]